MGTSLSVRHRPVQVLKMETHSWALCVFILTLGATVRVHSGQPMSLSEVKPGTCPPRQWSGLSCLRHKACGADDDCPNSEKCCSTYFGYQCLPVYKEEKPPRCPEIKPGTIGICVESCSSHDDCIDDKLCCSNGCGHVCMAPEY